MRYLLVIRSLNMGGIQQATLNMAQSLLENGDEVHLWIQKGKPQLAIPPRLQVHCFDIDKHLRKSFIGLLQTSLIRPILSVAIHGSDFIWRSWYYQSAFLQLLQDLEAQYGKFDKIFVRGEGAFENLCNVYDPRMYCFVEGNPCKRDRYLWHQWFLNKLYGNKQIISVSAGMAQILQECLDRNHVSIAQPIQVVYNSFNIERVKELSQQSVTDLPTTPYIIHVGRLHIAKNQMLLLEAFAQVKTEVQLLIIGDGPLRTSLMQKAQELGISNRVIFAGRKDNPYPYIQHAKAMVVTSPMEGLCLVLIEAIILGVNPIACRGKGGITDVMRGALAENLVEFDSALLAEKIDHILAHPLPMTAEMYELFSKDNYLKSLTTLQ